MLLPCVLWYPPTFSMVATFKKLHVHRTFDLNCHTIPLTGLSPETFSGLGPLAFLSFWTDRIDRCRLLCMYSRREMQRIRLPQA